MLGIIDWGIGGVGVYKELTTQYGETAAVYLSDTGVTPYGKMRLHELAERLESLIKYLTSEGAETIVIGCNAASTAIPHIGFLGIPVLGVIEPGVRLAAKAKPKRLGLIGGRRTVVSGAYREAFERRGIEVTQRIAQPLSALIETGEIDSEAVQFHAKRILLPLRTCSHILLACTHYPAAEHVLRRYVPESTVFLDPAKELVREIAKAKPASGKCRFLTTGDAAQMKKAAKAAFSYDIGSAKQVTF